MLEIMTIRDFYSLHQQQREEIQKALRVRDRLDKWLDERVNKKRPPLLQAEWKSCRVCDPQNPGWILHEPRNNSDIHPSQVCKCLKKLWYDCSGYAQEAEESIEPRLQRIFDLGHAWHHTVQSYGRAGAWGPKEFYRDEVTIDPGPPGSPNTALPVAANLWIRGSADAVIDRYVIPNVPQLGDVAVRMVHEYKTINSSGYTNLKKPKTEHKWQAMIYSAVFDVPLVVFLYLNKDTSAQIDYPLPFDFSLWQQIEQKLNAVKYYTEEGIMPPWEYTSAVNEPMECKQCGYFKLCRPDRR